MKDPASNHFVLALANRSAAHVRLNQWKYAVADLSMILGNLEVYRANENKQSNLLENKALYPYGRHSTPAKLWERLYSCLIALQKHDDAKLSLSICIEELKGNLLECDIIIRSVILKLIYLIFLIKNQDGDHKYY